MDEDNRGDHRMPDAQADQDHNGGDGVHVERCQVVHGGLRGNGMGRTAACETATYQRSVDDPTECHRSEQKCGRDLKAILRQTRGGFRKAHCLPKVFERSLLGWNGEDAERADRDEKDQIEGIPVVVTRPTSF